MHRLIIILIALVSLQTAPEAEARMTNACRDSERVERTLEELVDAAEYIGLYEVRVVKKDDVSKFAPRGRNKSDIRDSYSYTLDLVSNIKGRGPRDLEVTGIRPPETLPQVYFSIYQRHEEMANQASTVNSERLGLAPFTTFDNGKGCRPAPEFVEHYSYLVFGGVDTRAGFEPIHSSRYDAWYKTIKRIADSKN